VSKWAAINSANRRAHPVPLPRPHDIGITAPTGPGRDRRRRLDLPRSTRLLAINVGCRIGFFIAPSSASASIYLRTFAREPRG